MGKARRQDGGKGGKILRDCISLVVWLITTAAAGQC